MTTGFIISNNQYTLDQLGWKIFFNQQLTLENLENTSAHRVTQVFRNRLKVAGENGETNLDLAHYHLLQNCTIGD
jgi:ribosome biogenesis GTPase